MKGYKLLTAILILFFHCLLTNGQQISFLGIDQGLSNNSVRCIYQDHAGFMWFGTYDGLNRYDGYNFKVFRNKFADSSSLINNYIFSMDEDDYFNMWIGTHGGACIYNNLSGKFSPVFYQSGTDGQVRKITVGVRVIKAGSDGDMLLGTLGMGMLVKNKANQFPVGIPVIVGDKQIWNYDVQSIKSDGRGGIWVFVPQIGLCKLSVDKHHLITISQSVRSAFCIEPQDSNIWIGTGDGLFLFDGKSKTVVKVLDQAPGKLTFNKVSDLTLDKKGQLWMALNGGGINIYNTRDHKVTYLVTDKANNPVASDAAYTIYQDKDGRFWIGILNGGINIVDSQKQRFKTLTHDPGNANSLPKKAIYGIYEDAYHKLWLGTEGSGIVVWDSKKNNLKQFKNQPGNPHSLSDNFVTNIIKDNDNNIWIGTFFNGIDRYDKASGTFERYRCINPATKIENKVISTICQDDQTLWVGTLKGDGSNGALYRFNKASNQFDAFDTTLSDLWSITRDNEGQLWAGMLTQLVKIDRKNKKHQYFDLGYYLRSIYEDTQHNFWVGTEGGGLVLFDRSTDRIIARYTTENGLCNNSVLNILGDKEGNLWLSTFNGLAMFNPKTKIFKNYYKSDGLQSNQFHYNSKAVLHTGELVFGGVEGVNIFRAEAVNDINDHPQLVLSGIQVNNVPLEKDAPWVKEIASNTIKEIEVPYDKAVFSLEYTALEYTAPDKIKYAYFMDGWDHGWTYAENIRFANYTHLGEGNYTFRVKYTNAEGKWMLKQIALIIHVLPPWYRTWWAYLLYLAIIITAIYLYLIYHKKQAKLEYEMKFAEELNEKKIAFFTNISHELRTPLTLIVNPIKDLLHSNGANLDLVDISAVYRNSRRLLSLVDQLLLFRSSENEISGLQPAWLNLKDICYEVFLCFNNQVKAKRLNYIFICEEGDLTVFADREKLEIVLFNLLSNAVKYTPEGGKVTLEVGEINREIQILVKDDGYGIPVEIGGKLFEKFYRLSNSSESGSESGFGIGLFLAKKYMDLHKGALTYTSTPGAGTVFKICLPKVDRAHTPENCSEHTDSATSSLLRELIPEVDEVNYNTRPVDNHVDYLLEGIVNKRSVVLLIDDDADVRAYLRNLLKEDYTVYEAANTEKGFEIVLENEPDIIVCDVVMKGMSGVEFCSKIKDSPSFSHIPFILLTGSSSPEIKLKGIECGADDYITKPFENELLVARIKSMLKGRDTLKNYFFNEVTLKNNSSKIPSEYSDFLQKCITIVEAHLEDETFSLKTFTDEIGMSRSKLFRKIKSISGLSSTEFIRYIRLRKAAELMIQTDLQIKEIAFRIGFQDIKYFREQFNKLFEMNPSDFIKKYRKTFIKSHNLNSGISHQKYRV